MRKILIALTIGLLAAAPRADAQSTVGRFTRLLLANATDVRTGTGSPEGVVTAPVGSVFLRTDGVDGSTLYSKTSGVGNTGWAAVASTGGSLAQFASTTSAQLAGVLSDETGSGAAVFGTSPSLTTPTIAGAALSGSLSGTPTFTGAFSNTALGTHVLGPNASSVGSTATSLIISAQNSGNAGFSLRQGLTEKASFVAASDGNTYLDYQGTFTWRESSGFVSRMNLSTTGNLTISNASGTGLTVGSGATITTGNLFLSSGLITQTGAGDNSFAGNVGFGTTVPGQKADVAGGIALGVNTASANNLTFSGTAPTISSGFGTSPSITAGTATAFRLNVGTGGTANNGTVGMPTATNGWNCHVDDLTAQNTNRADQRTVQVSGGTNTVIVQNQTVSTGAGLAWVASDILAFMCAAF